jgi:uncharacterized protein YjdB
MRRWFKMLKKYMRKILCVIVMLAFIPNGQIVMAMDAWSSPNSVQLILAPEQQSDVNLVITTGSPPIKKLDVVFAIDTTGSMGGEIDQVKAKAIEIMNNIRSKVSNSQFGLVSFKDYPMYSPGDQPYYLNQSVTDNTTAVATAINGLTASGGGDYPESYSRVLYEMAIGSPKWRDGSKKLVILLGDAPTHDTSFAGYNYGVDPGPDGISGSADDLNFTSVVQQLKDSGIIVLAIQARNDSDAAATFKGASIGYSTALGTGGQYYNLSDTSELQTEVMKQVTEEVSNINTLSLGVPEEYKSWVSNIPAFNNVGPNETRNFNFTVKVPKDTASGDYSFPVQILGDGSVLSETIVSVKVVNGVVEGAGKFSFSSSNYGVLESDGNALITVNRTSGTQGSVTVDYSTSDGTGKAGIDYKSVAGTLTFNEGEMSKTFTIPIIDDSIYKEKRTVNISLSNPTGGATLVTPDKAVLTLADDDPFNPGVLEFESFEKQVSENDGKVSIEVNRTGGSDGTVSVNYATSNGTAIAGSDYTATSGILTFNKGETSKLIQLPILPDDLKEDSETLILTLSSPTGGAMLGSKSTMVVTINDQTKLDDVLTVTPSTIALEPGKTQQLNVMKNSADGSIQDITASEKGTTYSSNAPSIATVSPEGLVTAASGITKGTATITVRNNGKYVNCVVTVQDNSPKVTSLTVTPNTLTLSPGAPLQLSVTGVMTDGSTQDVTASEKGTTYSSNAPSIATVSPEGVVTAASGVTKGTATITVRNNGKYVNYVVTVQDNSPKVTSLTVSPNTLTLLPGATKQLSVTGVMTDGSTQDVTASEKGTTYSSNAPSIATVSPEGLVTAASGVTKGTATITIRNNGKYTTCVIYVR